MYDEANLKEATSFRGNRCSPMAEIGEVVQAVLALTLTGRAVVIAIHLAVASGRVPATTFLETITLPANGVLLGSTVLHRRV